MHTAYYKTRATMRNSKVSILADIAAAILAATRQRRATVSDWYLSDSEYEVYAEASRNLCGDTTMKICGASIHRLSSAATSLRIPDENPERESHYRT